MIIKSNPEGSYLIFFSKEKTSMSFIFYKIINQGSVQVQNSNQPEIRLTRLQIYQRLLRELQQQRQRLIEIEQRLNN